MAAYRGCAAGRAEPAELNPPLPFVAVATERAAAAQDLRAVAPPSQHAVPAPLPGDAVVPDRGELAHHAWRPAGYAPQERWIRW